MKAKTGKILSCLLIFGLVTALLGGCDFRTSKSFTFTVETGDTVKITLNTTDGYDLSSELPFVISCGDQTLSQGSFGYGDAFDLYASAVADDPNASALDFGTKDGNEYIYWNYGGTEFNYVIRVAGGNTTVILGNNVSEESARECFNRLTITLEK